MKEPKKCPQCGKPVPGSAPGGLCPKCMLKVGAAAPTEEVGPSGTVVITPSPKEPASVAEIARFFPQMEILECLGRGGMGVVYKARQPKLNRLVALKILAPEKEGDPKFAERFEREAQALARLNHPNIVAVYDFGETDGLFYLLMEYVDGTNLRHLIQTRRMEPSEALAIVPKICEALQFAHGKGVVHRDIKPENVLLAREGEVKIADFGIAKIVGEAARAGNPPPDAPPAGGGAPGVTRPATALTKDEVLGTPHYMAPEQMEHPTTVDHRADIYSLGVVFYEMLTGELPLGRFAPPSRKVQVDVRLDEVVLRTLEKEPDRRYQHASQVKTDVETISSGAGKSDDRKPQPASEARMDRLEQRRRALLWYGFLGGVFGLPAGLALHLPFVWGLSIAGIIIAGYKLGLLVWRPMDKSAAAPEVETRTVSSSRLWRKPLVWVLGCGLGLLLIGGLFVIMWGGLSYVWSARSVAVQPSRKPTLDPVYSEPDPVVHQSPYFHPVQHLTLNDCDIKPEALDFETGQILLVPEETRKQSQAGNLDWFVNSGVDLLTDTTRKGVGLITIRSNELKLIKLATEEWQSLTPAQLSEALGRDVSGLAEEEGYLGKVYVLPTNMPTPVILGFRTGTGVEGILEARWPSGDEQPPLTLRYKRALAGETVAGRVSKAVIDAPFIGRLPVGTVELVALSVHPSTDKRWWAPNGAPTEEGPFVTEASGGGSTDAFRWFSIVARLQGLPADASAPRWRLKPRNSWAMGRANIANDSTSGQLAMISTKQPRSAATATVGIGIASGAWVTVARATAGAIPPMPQPSPYGSVTFLPPTETEDGIRLTATHTLKDRELRLVAAEADGTEQIGTNVEQVISDASGNTTVTFAGLTLDSAIQRQVEFRCEARSYQWVEFRDVSLEPGLKTVVEVVQAPVEISARESALPASDPATLVGRKTVLLVPVLLFGLVLLGLALGGAGWWIYTGIRSGTVMGRSSLMLAIGGPPLTAIIAILLGTLGISMAGIFVPLLLAFEIPALALGGLSRRTAPGKAAMIISVTLLLISLALVV